MGCGILCSQVTAWATKKKGSLLEDKWNPNTRELAVQMTGLCGWAEWEMRIKRGSQSIVWWLVWVIQLLASGSPSPQAPVGRPHSPLAQGPESGPHQQAGITVVFLICPLQFTICCVVS